MVGLKLLNSVSLAKFSGFGSRTIAGADGPVRKRTDRDRVTVVRTKLNALQRRMRRPTVMQRQ